MGHPHLPLLLWHQPCCEALDSDPFSGLLSFLGCPRRLHINSTFIYGGAQKNRKLQANRESENLPQAFSANLKKTKNLLVHSVMCQMDFHEGIKNKWKTTVSWDSSHCMNTRDTFWRCKSNTGLWTKVNMEWDYFTFRKRKGGFGQILIGYSI